MSLPCSVRRVPAALFVVLVVSLPLKVHAETQITGMVQDPNIGDIRYADYEFYIKDTDGNYTHLKELDNDTGWTGYFSAKVPDKYKGDLESGNLFMRVKSVTDSVKVKDQSGNLYQSDFVKVRNEEGQVVNTNLQGDALGAFKVTNNIAETKSFMETIAKGDTEVDPNIPKDKQMSSDWDGFKNRNLIITYPATSTEYDAAQYFWQDDRIYIDKDNLDSGQRSDGKGDTVTHEFTHMMWKVQYGHFEWRAMLTRMGDHAVGKAYTNVGAFQENLAYFYESAFDGRFEDEIAGATPSKYLSNKKDEFDNKLALFQEAYKQYQAAEKAQDTKKMANTERVWKDAMDAANVARDEYNTYLKSLQKNPGGIDGLGANIFWDMYKDDAIGGGTIDFLRKFYKLVDDEQPWSMSEFYEDWVEEYPQDKQKLEQIFAKHGFSDAYDSLEEIPKIDWDQFQGIAKYSTVIIVDASGSMAGEKIAYAKAQATTTVKSARPDEEIALYAFSGCGSVKLLQPFTLAREQIYTKIDGIKAGSGTPLAEAISEATYYMDHNHSSDGQKGRIVLITDGGESCSKNPKEAAAGIKKLSYDVAFTVYGYNLTNNDKKELKGIAQAGGGRFKAKYVFEEASTVRNIKARAIELGAVGGAAAATTLVALSMGQAGAMFQSASQAANLVKEGARAAVNHTGPFGEAAKILARDIGKYSGPIRTKAAQAAAKAAQAAINAARKVLSNVKRTGGKQA